ncbi:hypothetical protein AVEN_168258-1 [Araneus ventricosus]|uniref:Reverse transcriptase domain-containing protein n=1 Tax=Araneus ventricosus TaxID=182803 RepID=A0A4Y2UBR4_ARAVE|nr:hypothetical protein AVEN_168258-1 [Araneus ventricosus]
MPSDKSNIALNNQDPSGNHLKIAQDILKKIFPHPANSTSSTYIPSCTANDCPFTKGEVATVIHHLSKRKAPGPDGIDNIIIQQIFKKFPFLLMELFNTCLKLAKFPDPLKVGNIIFFINTENLKQKHLLTGPYLCSRQ